MSRVSKWLVFFSYHSTKKTWGAIRLGRVVRHWGGGRGCSRFASGKETRISNGGQEVVCSFESYGVFGGCKEPFRQPP